MAGESGDRDWEESPGERDDGERRRRRSRWRVAEIEIAERRAERFGDEAEGKMQKRNEIRNSKSRLKMIRKVEKFALRETRTHLRSKLLPWRLRCRRRGRE